MTVSPHRLPRLAGRMLALFLITWPVTSWAADPQPGPPLSIRRVTGRIVMDGDLADAGWQGVEGVTT